MNQLVSIKSRRAYGGHYCGDSVVFLPLTRGQTAVLDADDWPRIRQQYGEEWYCNSNGRGRLYARHRYADGQHERAKNVTLQRAAVQARTGQRIKIHNGDSLDCRKRNLSVMTKQEELHLRRVHAR